MPSPRITTDRDAHTLTGFERDVAGLVDVTDTGAVFSAVKNLLKPWLTTADSKRLDGCMRDVQRLYAGDYPGYEACDVHYHDFQHILDVTLAMARIVDGYQRSVQSTPGALTSEYVLAAIIVSLFHDVGYLAKQHEVVALNGGEFTAIHVRRSAEFLAKYLRRKEYYELTPICCRTVYFTGHELSPDAIVIRGESERVVGRLMGTADLLAQMADKLYLKKCRDGLFDEFEASATAGAQSVFDGFPTRHFESRTALLKSTPAFMHYVIEHRLKKQLGGAYRYAALHFGGRDYYMESIENNIMRLEQLQREPGNWIDRL